VKTDRAATTLAYPGDKQDTPLNPPPSPRALFPPRQ
jgi:hypothetical protein